MYCGEHASVFRHELKKNFTEVQVDFLAEMCDLIQCSKPEVFRALLSYSSVKTFLVGTHCLVLAIGGNDALEKVQELLKFSCVNPSANNNIALAVAYSKQKYDIATELITDSRFTYSKMCLKVKNLATVDGQYLLANILTK